MVISSIGFKKFVWFISLGYGFSIAAFGLAMILFFHSTLSVVTTILSLLFIVYGLRLGLFLLFREKTRKSYNETMKRDVKDGSDMSLILKIVIWATCSLLYVCEVSPVLFRLQSNAETDGFAVVGMLLMILGICLESIADLTKDKSKKANPHTFCSMGVFKLVRCPNYLGEVITWTGVLVSGLSAVHGVWQWLAVLGGWIGIVYVMFGGARRLEIRQNRNYGSDPKYQEYVKKTPILLPFIPLYSVEKYKWLLG